MNDEGQLAMESVHERDCDLLLVEELSASRDFVSMFLSNVRGQTTAVLPTAPPGKFAAFRSVQRLDKSGETDIEARIEWSPPSQPFVAVLLIENKIDATFQPKQPQRYATYALWLTANQPVNAAFSVLVAPNSYLEAKAVEEFDAQVSYEEVVAYFDHRAQQSDNDEIRRRSAYRRQWFEQAIYKYRRGYTPDIDQATSNYWRDYWRIAQAQFPELAMEEPSLKPAGSDWIFFRRAIRQQPHLPRADFKHKLRVGRVEIELAGLGGAPKRVWEIIEASLDDGMEIRKAGKALAISLQGPPIDTQGVFNDSAVISGLRNAKRLKDWWERTASSLQLG